METITCCPSLSRGNLLFFKAARTRGLLAEALELAAVRRPSACRPRYF